jgi:hypothetical protein
MTNGGGLPEPEKAEDINKRIGLSSSSASLCSEENLKLLGDHMILCHTPLKDPAILQKYQDRHVIVTGAYNELNVALYYGYSKAIHVEELSLFYTDQIPNDLPLYGP